MQATGAMERTGPKTSDIFLAVRSSLTKRTPKTAKYRGDATPISSESRACHHTMHPKIDECCFDSERKKRRWLSIGGSRRGLNRVKKVTTVGISQRMREQSNGLNGKLNENDGH